MKKMAPKIILEKYNEKLIQFDDYLCSIVPNPKFFKGKKLTFYQTGTFKINMLLSDMEDLIKKFK